MADRFVVTGSGRCGTKYVSRLLSAAGLPCGHEQAYNADGAGQWAGDQVADSSWMAAAMLEQVDVPVALLVRHPLKVVRSFVEIGFFSPHDAANPTHGPLERFAPEVYHHRQPADRALAMWLALNRAALARAEVILRLEDLDAGRLVRLLRWAGAGTRRAPAAFQQVGPCNRHENMRELTGIRYEPTWEMHDRELARQAAHLAGVLGYCREEVPSA